MLVNTYTFFEKKHCHSEVKWVSKKKRLQFNTYKFVIPSVCSDYTDCMHLTCHKDF